MSSSEPASSQGIEGSLLTAGISEVEAQARATSSITITVARASAPDAAVLLRHVRCVEVRRPQRLVGGLGKLRQLVGLRRVRRHLRVADLADGGPERLVLLGGPVQIRRSRSQSAA